MRNAEGEVRNAELQPARHRTSPSDCGRAGNYFQMRVRNAETENQESGITLLDSCFPNSIRTGAPYI
jgi:hypothetical protein